MQIVSLIADIFGILSVIVSVKIWFKINNLEDFNEQRIQIKLKVDEQLIRLPGEIERKHLTRSEVQGLLGSLATSKPKERYQLDYLNTRIFFDNLASAQDKKEKTVLEIKCTPEELKQFDMEKLKNNVFLSSLI
jgi:hypothetical protein